MRTPFTFAAALLLAAGVARAQDISPAATTGSADLGVRLTEVSGDAARFQRFRDVGDGALVERFRFDQRGEQWTFESGADHLGRRDQRWFAELRAAGRVKVSFTWDQVPLYISGDTRTPYRVEAPGVLRLDDGLQRGIEAGQLRLADYIGGAAALDVRSRRHVAAFALLFTPAQAIDVHLNVKQTRRDGTQPQGASFGFNDAVEVAAPIDTRTTDVQGGVEWAGHRGMVRLGYDGSWFDNRVPTLVWDNPLKITDAATATAYQSGLGGAQGRAALPPGNAVQSVSAAASLALPARGRLTGNMMVGAWRQNQALLPVTINTAVPDIALPRETAEAGARTMALNYTFTARPTPYLWVNARYRYYEFDNRTPPFEVEEFVVLDQTPHHGTATEPLGYTRQNVDVDAAFTPRAFTVRAGYTRSTDDRTFRIVERTVDNAWRASIDSSGPRWILVRGLVERSVRRGSGFNEALLIAAGEQPAMRHYDIADRDRMRVTGLVQVAPVEGLGVSVSAATGRDEYVNSGFGLRDNQNRAYSATVEVTPTPQFAATLGYTKERLTAVQASRTASPNTPQVTDPTRDWFADSSDRADTVTGSLDWLRPLPRLDVRVGYVLTRSRALYLHRVPPDSTITRPVPLPPVTNESQTGTADLRFHLSPRVALGGVYWYERYTVDNFALSGSTMNSIALPGSLFLGYVYRPYTARAASLRLICTW